MRSCDGDTHECDTVENYNSAGFEHATMCVASYTYWGVKLSFISYNILNVRVVGTSVVLPVKVKMIAATCRSSTIVVMNNELHTLMILGS